MAYLESAVVVYLRAIAYPNGFSFPLVPLENYIAITEIFREAATMAMLVGISALLSKKFSIAFSYFIYCFAIWDIFYYVFLYFLLGWPESLLTWDVLFLIPVTWVGPVIAPVILSLTMVLFFMVIQYADSLFCETKIFTREWFTLIVGSLTVILSFTLDYMRYILQFISLHEVFIHPNRQVILNITFNYIPKRYSWGLFCLGEVIIVTGIAIYWIRIRKSKTTLNQP